MQKMQTFLREIKKALNREMAYTYGVEGSVLFTWKFSPK